MWVKVESERKDKEEVAGQCNDDLEEEDSKLEDVIINAEPIQERVTLALLRISRRYCTAGHCTC